jgi:hypothetical protein
MEPFLHLILHPSYAKLIKNKKITKAVRYCEKLVWRLPDHSFPYSSINSQQNMLSDLCQEPRNLNKCRILLCSSISKSDRWLQLLVQDHNVNPVLVESRFRNLSGKIYILIHFRNAIQAWAESWTLFRESLQENTVIANDGEGIQN